MLRSWSFQARRNLRRFSPAAAFGSVILHKDHCIHTDSGGDRDAAQQENPDGWCWSVPAVTVTATSAASAAAVFNIDI